MEITFQIAHGEFPCYLPHYDRTIEDEAAWHLVKYLDEACGLLYQHRVTSTEGLVTYVDFVVVDPAGRRIGIEFGQAGDAHSSPARDVLVMDTGALDVLYRADEEAALHSLHDVLYLVSRYEPDAFTERGRGCLHRLASKQAREAEAAPSGAHLDFRTEEDDADPFSAFPPPPLSVTRLAREAPLVTA